jgi:hypothetical protein
MQWHSIFISNTNVRLTRTCGIRVLAAFLGLSNEVPEQASRV